MRASQLPEAPPLVFCDEAHLHLDTDLRWGWARRGQGLYVHSDSPSLSRKRSCFGTWLWVRQELTALLHCHRDEEERTLRLAGFQASVNRDPSAVAVHARLRSKMRLD